MVGAGGFDPGFDESWWRDAFMGMGAALVLFSPFYFLTKALDDHVDRVETETKEDVAAARSEAKQDATAVRDEVQELREDVTRRLEDVSAAVMARLEARDEADVHVFAALRTTMGRQVLVDALKRAQSLGLVVNHPAPRVQIAEQPRCYVSFTYVEDWDELTLTLVDIAGHTVGDVQWPVGADSVAVLEEVGTQLKRTAYDEFNVAALFHGLSDLLEEAHDWNDLRPIHQLIRPQWALGGTNPPILRRTDMDYSLSAERLHAELFLRQHVGDKPDIDPDSWDEAVEVALAVVPDPRKNPWGEGQY